MRYPSALHYCGRWYNRDYEAGSRSAADALADDFRPPEYSGSTTLYPVFEFTAPLARACQ